MCFATVKFIYVVFLGGGVKSVVLVDKGQVEEKFHINELLFVQLCELYTDMIVRFERFY